MPAVQIKPDIYWIGVNDRTTDLFEGLWPIHDVGVTYNAYLINDEKKAIIDLAKAFKDNEFFDQISDVMSICDLDYVVLNHMEPDHSGILKILRKIASNVTILCSEKAVRMLDSYYGITDNIRVVQDGETVSLGKYTLTFYMIPYVHWPETMATYIAEQNLLFSCDAFGGYGAFQGSIFDSDCKNPEFYERESLRYYVNIVAKFSNPVLKAIAKLSELDIDVIAPSHGLIWKKNPARIVSLYKEWAELAEGPGMPGVTLLYGSMYGNTEKMMNAVAQGISSTGIQLDVFDVARTHASYILPALWRNAGVIIGAPTYEGNLFKPMSQLLQTAAHKRITNKKFAYFGSYGWSKGALKNLKLITDDMKWYLTDIVEFEGEPKKDILKQGELIGSKFAKMILS